MTRRARVPLLAGLTSSAAALALVAAATPAGAADSPRFLDTRDLPRQAGNPWYAGPVTAGTPDPLPYCFGEALPGATSVHRSFRTDRDTNAVQVTVVERDEASAKTLAALLTKAVRTCAERTEQQHPDVDAQGRDLGRVRVEDGATVYGVRTASELTSDIHLFSVGRDGRTVTVVHWGRMGGWADAPVQAFKKTTRTAVRKLA